ncbi:MAG: hypothetical protein GX610_20475 [Rhodococcus sp.]|nr:hypothetical protein [Rhodococcus sp. (in: high G+C Gram-positive bacteria)]
MTFDAGSSELSVPSASAVTALRRSFERARETESLWARVAVWGVPVWVTAGILWGLSRKESGLLSSWGLLEVGSPGSPYGVAVVLVGLAAVAFWAMRAIGPVTVGEDEMHWVFSSPVDRRTLLRRQLASWALGAVIAGVLAARFVTLLIPVTISWWIFAPLGSVSALGVLGLAIHAQGRLDRRALTRGADLATGLSASVVSLDPSYAASALERRSWRRLGAVRSRVFTEGRVRSLLEADIRRVVRGRSAPVSFLIAAGIVFGATVVGTPLAVVLVQTLACFAVGSAFSGGLLDVCRSDGLRSLLGGTDRQLRLIHLPVPATAILVLWLVTIPAAVTGGWAAASIAPAAAAVAMYRARSRPPMQYGGTVLETGFGQVPIDVLRQMVRGPAILVVALVLQAVLVT